MRPARQCGGEACAAVARPGCCEPSSGCCWTAAPGEICHTFTVVRPRKCAPACSVTRRAGCCR
jgi:hypothetical protein